MALTYCIIINFLKIPTWYATSLSCIYFIPNLAMLKPTASANVSATGHYKVFIYLDVNQTFYKGGGGEGGPDKM